MASAHDVVIGPGEGETITEREHRDLVILAERDDITITRTRYGPGEHGPDPHVHHEHTDSFYVVEGELTFLLGREAERIRVPAGSFVAAPPHVVHSFFNEASADAHFLPTSASPSGSSKVRSTARTRTTTTTRSTPSMSSRASST